MAGTPDEPLPGLAWSDDPPPPPPREETPPTALDAVKAALTARFADRFSVNETVRRQHGHTLTWTENQPPDAVVFPKTTEEVAEIVKLCAAHRTPVIPFGTGTSLEGHVNAPHGGVCIDLSLMKRVVAIHPEDLDCVVEAGVTRKELNEALRQTGLFFPIDPGADASLGGMASTRASGTNAVRYGTMKENVLALTVVTAKGDIIRTARRAKKSSAGYDLTRLFVGAEGTLGVITELTLKLYGLPETITGGVCPFPSVQAACDATILTIQSGVPVARIELLDEQSVRAVNLHSRLGLPETPMLLVEFHGTEAGAREQAERFGEIAAELGGGPFTWASKPEERTRLWQARHDAYWACFTLRPGAKALATDVCVPISRLAECVTETQRDLAESRLLGPIVGHVGDGNFHVNLLLDMADDDEVARAEAFLARLVRRGLDMDGTCTGEHGVGQAKMKHLVEEHGLEALALMRALKAALDPGGIMNPGKIVA
ncbi:MAG TPA: FAD-linked oxidase C-terminal domain-containing protein [Beijerinckiaceae bacterium]